jgi:hypothetical protein
LAVTPRPRRRLRFTPAAVISLGVLAVVALIVAIVLALTGSSDDAGPVEGSTTGPSPTAAPTTATATAEFAAARTTSATTAAVSFRNGVRWKSTVAAFAVHTQPETGDRRHAHPGHPVADQRRADSTLAPESVAQR